MNKLSPLSLPLPHLPHLLFCLSFAVLGFCGLFVCFFVWQQQQEQKRNFGGQVKNLNLRKFAVRTIPKHYNSNTYKLNHPTFSMCTKGWSTSDIKQTSFGTDIQWHDLLGFHLLLNNNRPSARDLSPLADHFDTKATRWRRLHKNVFQSQSQKIPHFLCN